MPYTGPEPTNLQIKRQLLRMLELSPFTEREAQAKLFKAMVEIALVRDHVSEIALLKRVYRGNENIDASVVRVQAKNLEKTVAEYYERHGANDPVQIHLPQWVQREKKRQPEGKNYRPVFQYNLKHGLTIKYFTAWRKMCGPQLSRLPEALQAFEEILNEDGEYADAWFALADGHCILALIVLVNRPEERAHVLERAKLALQFGKEIAPQTWHAYASAGFLHLLHGEFDESSQAFASAVVTNRLMAEAHPAYLFFYLATKGPDASELMANRALELSRNAELQAVHGRMLEWADKPEEAERYYRLALDLDPNNGLCHWGLARMLERAGKEDEAQEHMERAEILLGAENLGMWLQFEKSVNEPGGAVADPDQSDADDA